MPPSFRVIVFIVLGLFLVIGSLLLQILELLLSLFRSSIDDLLFEAQNVGLYDFKLASRSTL